MNLVVIESPYAGNIKENLEYARRCLLDSLSKGEAPLASHLLYPQVLDDSNPVERKLGLEAGFAWNKLADLVAVYEDRGISVGMELGIKLAEANGIPVEYRKIK